MKAYNEAVYHQAILFGNDHIKKNGWWDDIGDYHEWPVLKYHYCPDDFPFVYIHLEIITTKNYFRYFATIPFRVSAFPKLRWRAADIVNELNRRNLPGSFEIDTAGHLVYNRMIHLPSWKPDIPVEDELFSGIGLYQKAAHCLAEAIDSPDKQIDEIVRAVFHENR